MAGEGWNQNDLLQCITSSSQKENHSGEGFQSHTASPPQSHEPRLPVLLQNIPTLYAEKRDFFQKTFQDSLKELTVKTMQRRLSLDSPRKPSRKGDKYPLKPERFRVKTLDVSGGVQQGGHGATSSN